MSSGLNTGSSIPTCICPQDSVTATNLVLYQLTVYDGMFVAFVLSQNYDSDGHRIKQPYCLCSN